MFLKIKSRINALRKRLELITEPDMFIPKKIQLFQSNYDLFPFSFRNKGATSKLRSGTPAEDS